MNEILMIGSLHGFSFCFCVDGIFKRCQVSMFLSLRMGEHLRDTIRTNLLFMIFFIDGKAKTTNFLDLTDDHKGIGVNIGDQIFQGN